ncbi:TetR/AcrR family transcriptional regulator [Methylobacterium marchantiae]|uniref:TetR/AcrR family transcriptional regulator n=1 Tax=Methylobacterium marchantiae TaxID=600331 RepID=A0ABW3WZW1_9HYPH|nr:putative HTH-type transcriptional regulator [Methylobacterium marchantiae]
MPRVSQEQAKLNRQRVVDVAAALFRERGLNGVGVADIMASAGLTHGGFYGQFANKEALAAEAFDHALSDRAQAKEYRESRDALLSMYLSLGHVTSPGQGCPVAALANDVAREAPDSPVRSRFTQGVRHLSDLLVGLMPKGSEQRRRQRALATMSTMVGAVVLARAVNDETLAKELILAAHSSASA